ncbi:HlyD family secretion protein [Clostridium sp. P21]|uniref:HlyD family secretion protein n=1 Tax=Clostridium muellerianum TaxID=2716538 RepID=A0A7Y0HQ43_9CLOT|nr:HlyD family efflux transporter periplasmic adaptor subunit [Clostridium muellerianum]NMM64845.1 HlyD family secretion protein [Clostridium muellerianum]
MKSNKKMLLIPVFILMLVVVGGIIAYYWYDSTYFVSTDDSTVQSDLVKVAPQITGKLAEINIKDGQYVEKDQIVGRIDMGSLPDTSMDSSIVRAPIDGVVLKKQGTAGEIVTAGQPLATMINPSAIYINANIDETKVKKVKIGQKVDITIDQYDGLKLTGKVTDIGEYANSDLAIIPTSTSGTFTKVVQKIPVKISLSENNYKLLPGTNTVVKIHVK